MEPKEFYDRYLRIHGLREQGYLIYDNFSSLPFEDDQRRQIIGLFFSEAASEEDLKPIVCTVLGCHPDFVWDQIEKYFGIKTDIHEYPPVFTPSGAIQSLGTLLENISIHLQIVLEETKS